MRAAASGHSFTDIACTDGVMVRLDRLNRVLDVDRASGGWRRSRAAIVLRDLSEALYDAGLALENLGDIDVQTIAGAISTATHGTGAALRQHLEPGRGDRAGDWRTASLVECSRDSDPDLWRAARVSAREPRRDRDA